jgi:MSHA biogenesis protein MshL
MGMKNVDKSSVHPLFSVALASALLAGCAAPWVPQGETYGKIVGATAAQSKSKGDVSNVAINEALLPPLQIEAPRSPRTAEPRFDLAVNNAQAGQLFMAMVAGTRYSMLLPPDLTGTVTVNLKDVTVREALETMRDLYGYDFRVRGTRITIIPNTLQTRLFQVSYLASKRGGTTSTRVSSSGGGGPVSGAGGSTQNVGQQASAGSNVGQESANVFTGVLSDFWFDLAQAMTVVLGCDTEGASDSRPVTAAPGQVGNATIAGQLLTQRAGRPKCADNKTFMINAQSGVVMVRAMPAELREVERLLKALQLSIERQVMIEAKIVEVQLNDEFRTGINWAAFDKNGGHRWSNNGNTENYAFPGGKPLTTSSVDSNGNITINPATLTGALGVLKSFPVAGALGLAFQTSNFAALINFLQTQGTVYVMSNPRIATLNNQKAVIKVGSDDYFITSVTPPSYSTSTGSSTPTINPPTINTQPFFSGIALDVTPQIDDTGIITLHIRPSVTDVSEKDKTINFGQLGTYTLPYASTKVKESDSIVRVRDGMIVAIGGLMSEGQVDGVNKVPGAGDVPFFGHFFKQTGRAMNKRELVILLKPTLIQEDNDWRQDMEDTEERLREYDPQRFSQPVDIFRRQ